MVLGDLREFTFFRQIVDSAVSYVAKMHDRRRQPAKTQGRAHASAFFVVGTHLHHLLVDTTEELRQDLTASPIKPHGSQMKRLGQQLRNFVDRDLAGELSGVRPAHAVTNCEDEVISIHGSGTILA